VGGEKFFLEGLDLEGAVGMEFLLHLVVPHDERALVNMDLVGDVGEAPALGPQLDELIFSLRSMHGAKIAPGRKWRAAPGI
jgi:hypothetical protein